MIYRFDPYELDTDRFELRRSGAPVRVEPQVFEVLAHLVAHRDRVVPREELLDVVWGDRFVGESVLTSRLTSARRAVGDDGREQRVLRTVHGRGYRFVAALDGDDTVRQPSSAVERPAAWPLVGRAVEMAALADVVAGHTTGGVLLTGAAGAGKTRLAEEVLVAAEAAGAPVVRVLGHPEGRGLPLAALTHLLPLDVADAGPDGELDQAAVFHRARLALQDRAVAGRLVLSVDDVDHLDDLSVAVVASLVVAGDACAVLTMRTPGSVPSPLRALVKDGHLRRLEVGPLDDGEVERLLHVALDGPVDVATAQHLVATAGGNPAVLRQLVRSALEDGVLRRRQGVWALDGEVRPTRDLRHLVAGRLADLPATARTGLELLAVSGPVGLDVVCPLVGEHAMDLLDRRGLLQVVESGRRVDVAVPHPLFAEVLRADLPAARGRDHRLALAAALESRGARRREDLVRITAWRLDAGGSVDARTVSQAVRLALAQGDHRLAGRLLDRMGEGGDATTAVQLRAEWHFRRGENEQVEVLLAGLEPGNPPPRQWAQIVRRRAANRFYGLGDFDGAVALLDDGVASLEGEPRLALEALRCTLLALGGRVDLALERTTGVLASTTGANRLEILRARALALAVSGSCDAAIQAARDGLALAAELPPDLHLPGRSVLRFATVVALTEVGRLAEAGMALDDARRFAGAEDDWSSLAAARLALACGNPAEVRRQLERPLHRVRGSGQGATERWLLALVAHSRLDEGDVERAERELRRVTELEDGPRGLFHNEIDRAKAWLAAHRHGPDAASALLMRSAEDAGASGKRTFEATLLHDVVRLGRAAPVVARLGRLAATAEGPLAQVRADHARAVAAADAVRLLAVADAFAALGAVLLAAEASAQAVPASAQRGDSRGADRACDRSRALLARCPVALRTPALLTNL